MITSAQKRTVKEFVNLAINGNFEYSDNQDKEKFHKKGMAVCRLIAQELGLTSEQRQIRSNMGGIAVSGEVTLHADNVYIQFSKTNLGPQFMYRHCNGQKDYLGGRNRWMRFTVLVNHWELAIEGFKEAQVGP